MRQTKTRLLAEQKPLSVIDVVTAGFEVVRRRPWTLAIPIFLDLLIWLLPRLSLADLFRPITDQMFDTTGLTPDLAANVQDMQQATGQFISSLDVAGVVAATLNSIVRMPSLLTLGNGDLHSPINSLAYTLSLESGLVAILIALPMFLLGLFFAAVYVEWIAQGVRPLGNGMPFAAVTRVAFLWLKFIGLSAIYLLLLVAAGFILLLGQMLVPVGREAVSFVTGLVAVGLFWTFVYFFFAICAMAVAEVGVIEGIRRSVLLFRLFFWASFGLVLLVLFLDRGLAIIWHGLLVDPLGVIVGVIANAFIGTGLLAATMIFYQDRMNYTQKLIARAKEQRG